MKLLDVIKESDHPEKIIHCVFEYCPTTLSKLIENHFKTKTPFELKDIQTMMKGLLEGLDLIHSKLILHRDIKPDNILFDEFGMFLVINSI